MPPARAPLRLGQWGALVLATCIAGPALGGDWSLLVNGKAVHMNTQPGLHYNERNWGVGLQYDFVEPDRKWIPFVNASEFKDSNGNVSSYAGGGIVRRFKPLDNAQSVHVDVGAVGFLMQRKHFHSDRPFPGVLPVLSVGTQQLALNITYIPSVDPKMVPLWFFQLKVGLPW